MYQFVAWFVEHTCASVVQALTVLEFLIKRGSDRCVENSQVLLPKLEDLQVFEYTSPDGRDHGVNVRHRYAPSASAQQLITSERGFCVKSSSARWLYPMQGRAGL